MKTSLAEFFIPREPAARPGGRSPNSDPKPASEPQRAPPGCAVRPARRFGPFGGLALLAFLLASMLEPLHLALGQNLVTNVPPCSVIDFDDGLSGSCCAQATLNIPPLPFVSIEAASVCWSNCEPRVSTQSVLTLTPGPWPGGGCGVFYVALVGVSGLSANLKLHYACNYRQLSSAVGWQRVFRYVVVGEIIRGPLFCPKIENVEPPPYYVYGFIDYAYRCDQNRLTYTAAALTLGHNKGCFSHRVGCPYVPASIATGAHPDDAWALVAPEMGFVPSGPGLVLVPPSFGSAVGPCVALRHLNPTSGNVCPINTFGCTKREEFKTVSLLNERPSCICSSIFSAPQYTPQRLTGVTTCGSMLTPNPICPEELLPPFTLWTWSIGLWISPGPFPALPRGYAVFLTEGAFDYQPGLCTTTCPSLDIVYGVESEWINTLQPRTRLGPFMQIQRRVDLVNNLDISNGIGGVGVAGFRQEATRVITLDQDRPTLPEH